MSTRIRCVLLDDELPGLAYLKLLCEQIPELEIVRTYNDPRRLLSERSSYDFDLCILDVDMPVLNGIEVASALADKMVIFATAYREYAADAFEVAAVDFVQKPLTKERLQSAVRRAVAAMSMRSQTRPTLQLNTDQGKTLLPTGDLAYITTSPVDSRDKVAVMLDQSEAIIKNISFESLAAQLPEGEFVRINKSQLIAIRIVSAYTFDTITTTLTKGGKALRLTLSEKYRNQFRKSASPAS